jgi:hypothetical protein
MATHNQNGHLAHSKNAFKVGGRAFVIKNLSL